MTMGGGVFFFWIARIRLAHHENDLLAVGRPAVGVDPALHVAGLDGLAAGAVQQPQLAVLCALARRHEREVLVVGAPPRLRFAVR